MKIKTLAILQRAAAMAASAHEGAKLRDGATPYIAHPMRVSLIVSHIFGCSDAEVIAGALLHDTLEKTSLTPEEIETEFGPKVLRLVLALTKDASADPAKYWNDLKANLWEARLIKMADALDHLDCPPEDLSRRIKGGRQALELAHSDEEPIRIARKALEEALAAAETRADADSTPRQGAMT
ncbi:MAG: HD domain-containing protein [Luteolibacter sp.]